mgnify:CR=1 FL=1
MKSKIILSALILLIFTNITKINAQWYVMETRADSLVQLGINDIYNVDFASCEKIYKQIQREYPGNLAGLFLEATSDWWKLQLNSTTRQYDRQFMNSINKVINKSQSVIDTSKFDLGAIFFKAAAIGYRARYYSIREQWVNAAMDGHTAYKLMIEGLKLAPNNRDMLFGVGYYNYFSQVLPEQMPIIKPLISFIPMGNKKVGIKQIKASSESARYAAVEAEIVLLQIYYQFEKDYDNAIEIARSLHKKYPNNPYFYKYLGRLTYILSYFNESEKIWYDLLKKGSKRTYGYDDLLAREAMYYYGDILLNKGQYDRALKYLTSSSKMSNKVDDESSGFVTLSNLKIGMIYDKKNNRKKALEYYNKVESAKDYLGSKSKARQYIQNPYR